MDTAATSVKTLVVNRQQNTSINAVATPQLSSMATLKSDLRNSVIIPESDVPFQCKMCSKSSLDKKSFLGHLTGMHFCVQVCTRQKFLLYVHPKKKLAHNLGALYIDNVMSHNELTTLI